MSTFAVFVVIIALSECSIPSNFKRCKREDPNFKSCLLDAAQHGLTQLTKPYKELNLPNLEPMKVTALTVRTEKGSVNVNQNFTNCELFGFTKMKLDKYELDFDKRTLDVRGVVPELIAKCHYTFDGKLLLLTLDSEGNSTIVFSNFRAVFQGTYTETVKKHKTFLKIIHSEMEAEPDHVQMQFDNLFKGNQELTDNTNRVFNENWKEIYQEIKADYTELMKALMTQIMSNFLGKVPLEEIFS